jgi:hypothetical protein
MSIAATTQYFSKLREERNEYGAPNGAAFFVGRYAYKYFAPPDRKHSRPLGLVFSSIMPCSQIKLSRILTRFDK